MNTTIPDYSYAIQMLKAASHEGKQLEYFHRRADNTYYWTKMTMNLISVNWTIDELNDPNTVRIKHETPTAPEFIPLSQEDVAPYMFFRTKAKGERWESIRSTYKDKVILDQSDIVTYERLMNEFEVSENTICDGRLRLVWKPCHKRNLRS